MTVSSGIRPYAYEREAFTLQVNEKIGFSGVLFEEPMFVITAEKAIYVSGDLDSRKFTKYINKDEAISAEFEPRPDGKSLDGTNDDPALSGVEDGPVPGRCRAFAAIDSRSRPG